MSFWDNNKESIFKGAASAGKYSFKGAKFVGKAGYQAVKNQQSKSHGGSGTGGSGGGSTQDDGSPEPTTVRDVRALKDPTTFPAPPLKPGQNQYVSEKLRAQQGATPVAYQVNPQQSQQFQTAPIDQNGQYSQYPTNSNQQQQQQQPQYYQQQPQQQPQYYQQQQPLPQVQQNQIPQYNQQQQPTPQPQYTQQQQISQQHLPQQPQQQISGQTNQNPSYNPQYASSQQTLGHQQQQQLTNSQYQPPPQQSQPVLPQQQYASAHNQPQVAQQQQYAPPENQPQIIQQQQYAPSQPQFNQQNQYTPAQVQPQNNQQQYAPPQSQFQPTPQNQPQLFQQQQGEQSQASYSSQAGYAPPPPPPAAPLQTQNFQASTSTLSIANPQDQPQQVQSVEPIGYNNPYYQGAQTDVPEQKAVYARSPLASPPGQAIAGLPAPSSVQNGSNILLSRPVNSPSPDLSSFPVPPKRSAILTPAQHTVNLDQSLAQNTTQPTISTPVGSAAVTNTIETVNVQPSVEEDSEEPEEKGISGTYDYKVEVKFAPPPIHRDLSKSQGSPAAQKASVRTTKEASKSAVKPTPPARSTSSFPPPPKPTDPLGAQSPSLSASSFLPPPKPTNPNAPLNPGSSSSAVPARPSNQPSRSLPPPPPRRTATSESVADVPPPSYTPNSTASPQVTEPTPTVTPDVRAPQLDLSKFPPPPKPFKHVEQPIHHLQNTSTGSEQLKESSTVPEHAEKPTIAPKLSKVDLSKLPPPPRPLKKVEPISSYDESISDEFTKLEVQPKVKAPPPALKPKPALTSKVAPPLKPKPSFGQSAPSAIKPEVDSGINNQTKNAPPPVKSKPQINFDDVIRKSRAAPPPVKAKPKINFDQAIRNSRQTSLGGEASRVISEKPSKNIDKVEGASVEKPSNNAVSNVDTGENYDDDNPFKRYLRNAVPKEEDRFHRH